MNDTTPVETKVPTTPKPKGSCKGCFELMVANDCSKHYAQGEVRSDNANRELQQKINKLEFETQQQREIIANLMQALVAMNELTKG